MPRAKTESTRAVPEPITVRVATAVEMLGISRAKFYLLLADGEFEIIKVGRCTLVVVEGLKRFVERQRTVAERY